MAAETIIFYEMPLWERGGFFAMAAICLGVAYGIWRAPREVEKTLYESLKHAPYGAQAIGLRGFAVGVAIFGAVCVLFGSISATVALEPGGLRCGGHGLIHLGEFRSARTTTYKEGGGKYTSPRYRTGLALVPQTGHSTICREFDYLDDDSRARLLALVRDRLGR